MRNAVGSIRPGVGNQRLMPAIRNVAVALTVALTLATGVSAGPTGQSSPLEDPARPEQDRVRDAGSRPLEVYEWIGIEPGMTVADLMPFSGTTRICSAMWSAPRAGCSHPGRSERPLSRKLRERFTAAGLSNVEPMLDVSGIADDSIDVWLTVRNVHDLFIPAIGEQFGFHGPTVLSEMLRTLKPGGILGVVDARTPAEGLDAQHHRLNETHAIQLLEAAGFELVDRSEMLRVPDDDYTEMGFPTRWDVDRFLLKFRKPS